MAALGWCALALQLALSIRQTMADGRPLLAAVWIYLGFFTILTNLLAAGVLTALAWSSERAFARWLRRPNVLGATAMSIIIVGAIYNLLLRQLWHPQGWQWIADVTLHDVMPVAFVLCWWLSAPKPALRWANLCRWLVWPTVYFIYALTRGAIDGWYPYPFLDVGALGYPRVVINAMVILLAFVAVAVLLLVAARWQVGHSGKRSRRA